MIRDGRPFRQILFNSVDTITGTGASTTELLFALFLYLVWFSVFFVGAIVVVRLENSMIQSDIERHRTERKRYVQEMLQISVSFKKKIEIKPKKD